MSRTDVIAGGVLNPSTAIQQQYAASILALVRRMAEETKAEMVDSFGSANHHAAMDDDKGGGDFSFGNVASRARIGLNGISEKYTVLFNRLAKRATKRMVARTLKSSDVTLGMSLKAMSESITMKMGRLSPSVLEAIAACSAEAVSLIKLIPQQYLAGVQGSVMQSITSGAGLKDLVPELARHYAQNIRHARNVAMDQTRKTYTNVNAVRLKAIGVQQFEWIHVPGSIKPRQEHIALSGKVFNFDDLPVIGVMYGSEVRGLPSTLPFCRCIMRPLVIFGETQ